MSKYDIIGATYENNVSFFNNSLGIKGISSLSKMHNTTDKN